MQVEDTRFENLRIVRPDRFVDDRGFFVETYQESRYHEVGITDKFVQDNQSRSKGGVLRGLHFQKRFPQAQLLTVLRGCVYDVVVDMRHESETFGQWFGIELSDEGTNQIYMGAGFAHGFCVLSDVADLHYKVTREYTPCDEGGLLWSDPAIDIDWPIEKPLVCARDAAFPRLAEILEQGQL